MYYLKLPESRKANTEDRKEEDIRKLWDCAKLFVKYTSQMNIWKKQLDWEPSNEKERQLLITLKEENKKWKYFRT